VFYSVFVSIDYLRAPLLGRLLQLLGATGGDNQGIVTLLSPVRLTQPAPGGPRSNSDLENHAARAIAPHHIRNPRGDILEEVDKVAPVTALKETILDDLAIRLGVTGVILDIAHHLRNRISTAVLKSQDGPIVRSQKAINVHDLNTRVLKDGRIGNHSRERHSLKTVRSGLGRCA
jgi:hypothetical protein